MSLLKITGGRRLSGEVEVQGAKNSVLPIMAASLLNRGETMIHNCPELSDVDAAVKILRHLGCVTERYGGTLCIDSSEMTRCDIPDALMREMRSSVMFLGAILSRAGEAVLSLPGGCELGPRPIDMHLSALKALGADVSESGGNIVCHAQGLSGCRIDLALPSVGATENSMLAASGCSGTAVITNAAREPEIVDLQAFLNKMGCRVSGAGTSVITVEGTKERGPVTHSVIPDRIAAATYIAAAAACGGDITVRRTLPCQLSTVTDVFSEMGCAVTVSGGDIRLVSDGILDAPRPIITKPYPGFPTDAQPPIMAASLCAAGTTVFVENIFQNRYRHVGELLRMGADIRTEGRVAMVSGVKKLHGAPVEATDLRGGAALVVAALAAEGETEVSGVHHIDRGYDDIAETMGSLGADIRRV